MKYSQIKDILESFDKETVRIILYSYSEEILLAGIECNIPIDNIAEAYQGEYSDGKIFAEAICEDLYDLGHEGWHPAKYIDWDRVAKDLMMDYCEDNGYYFRLL